jgi:hypothetical protein
MRSLRGLSCSRFALVLAIVAMEFSCFLFAQEKIAPQKPALATSQALITQPINESQLMVLKGNTHPLARAEFDLGTAAATLPMNRMLLVLKRSAQQEADLEQLLDDQLNTSSANYHKWLTPEEFGGQYGATDGDVQMISSWLQSHGFQVAGTAKGRNTIEFSGSASQVQEAFHTAIHKYLVKGAQYWANSGDPQIPAALANAVAGVDSMNNFPRKPMSRLFGQFSRDKSTGAVRPVTPLYTFLPQNPCSADNYCFAVGPYDFATIYNVQPLWNSSINGTGQTIAIVGESNINPQDVASFRAMFGLPANGTTNPLNIILNGPDPGIQADESEADIDVQWSGAVAPYATIDFVVSQSTETTSGIDLSAVYIVDNNLAPVMSESYGYCELALGTTGNQFYNALWQQAAAQGITVFISAGDSGAAGCDDFAAQSPSPAQYGLEVSGYASTPYNVAVGGTDFNEWVDPTKYWNTVNNSTTESSALGYIPETTWNDSCTNSNLSTLGYSTDAETNCNNANLIPYLVAPGGGSGGMSSCTTPSGSAPSNCAGGYAKPAWQTGTGVPNDSKRDLPDVSLFASNGFAGSFYIICQSDQTYGQCNLTGNTYFLGFGGTSVSSPAFAGIMALVNQKTGSRQGNANYTFYKLAAKQSAATCNSSTGPASSCIFNDVTSGTIAMPCSPGTANCTTGAGDQYGILTGYNAGTGYDQATGLGSVNANNLVTQWSSATTLPSTTTLNSLTPTTLTHGQAANFSVTVKPQSGGGTPTGLISLVGGANNQPFAGFNLSGGSVSGSSELLPAGTYSLTAHYDGDATYSASDSGPISVTVSKENSLPQVFLVTFDSNGNIVSGNTTTATYGSPYLLRADVANAAGVVCNPAGGTQTTCPTGAVTMTNNGSTLDAGTYTLNSYGYFEDYAVQLPGGTDSVKASYAGDTNFNAGSSTTPLIITPASTSMTPVYVPGQVPVGSTYVLSTTVSTQSSGAAPTGTVSFFSNGVKLPGTPQTYGNPGSLNNPAFLNASLYVTFSAAGTQSITASYSGDTNYGASTASAVSVSALYTTTESVTASQQIVSAGTTVLLTALVDTTVNNLSPTGTITFSGSPTAITGTPTYTTITDSNGFSALQATVSVVVTTAETVYVSYSGDSNFFSGTSNAFVIGVPDFALGSPSNQLTITEGQAEPLTLNVSELYGFNAPVSNFTCIGLPAETTCSFSPASVTGAGSTTLTVATTPLGHYSLGTSAINRRSRWVDSGWVLAIGVCLLATSGRRRRRGMLTLFLCMALVMFPSCGGNSNSVGVTNNPVPSISSLSPNSMAAGSALPPAGLTVNGSGFISSSTVTVGGTERPAILSSATQLSVPIFSNDLATTATLPVIVTNPGPGGGASTPVNFSVVTGTPTGTFQITVTATSGSLTHNFGFTLVVQ